MHELPDALITAIEHRLASGAKLHDLLLLSREPVDCRILGIRIIVSPSVPSKRLFLVDFREINLRAKRRDAETVQALRALFEDA